MKDNQRNVELDIVKGIGMILMVMAHTYGPESLLWRIVYPFHMPLFFIISGYFFKEKRTNLLIYASFNRLIKPYLFICAVVTFIKFIQHLVNPSMHFIDIISILNGIGPGWFLISLFWSKVIFNLIIKYFSNHYFVISIFISSIVSLTYSFIPIKINLALPQGLSCLVFIAVGYIVKQKDILTIIKKHSYIIIILSIIFWMITFNFGQVEISKCTYKLWIIDYLGAIGGTCFCYYFASYIKNHSSFLSTKLGYISIYSIAILAFHAIDYTIFFWHHLSRLIKTDYLITYIALGRLTIILLSIFITSRIPFLYHLFIGKDK